MKRTITILFVFVILLETACSPMLRLNSPLGEPGINYTQSAYTVEAMLTQSSSTLEPMLTQTVPPTDMPSPSPTGTASPTPTLFPSTLTPTTVSYCDWLSFVKDVTIPDASNWTRDTTITKTWRIKNRGTCSWTPDYSLVFSHGAQMGGPSSIRLPKNVNPGETVDISVTLTVPETPGHYIGYWMLKNASGTLFGYGENANKAFFVDIYSVNSSYGTVSGRICFPSEHIPAMTLYLQNMSKNKLFRFPIQENQFHYQFQLEPGEYLAYAWTLNFEIAGGYTYEDHRLKSFYLNAGKSVTGIDICDWYGEPGTIPLPKDENYGSITGKLFFPSEHIPPLRIVAFDIYNDAYHWVDTVDNQQFYEINGLMPGYYQIVAYEKNSGFAGGYSEYAKCGLLSSCPDDHTLVTIYVTPGFTNQNINPGDWYAPSGTFPEDPTK